MSNYWHDSLYYISSQENLRHAQEAAPVVKAFSPWHIVQNQGARSGTCFTSKADCVIWHSNIFTDGIFATTKRQYSIGLYNTSAIMCMWNCAYYITADEYYYSSSISRAHGEQNVLFARRHCGESSRMHTFYFIVIRAVDQNITTIYQV